MLNWHASSSKQKSDMLAIQNSDGDLRVWSVPKPPTSGQPRVIRVLKRNETFVQGRNWVSWSKNGRILQFSEGQTWAWDVRTKDVNYVPVPTIEYVKGIAAHGPSAALFTLGPDFTVQQYDVETGQMIANIRHTPITIPPTPPEDHTRQFHSRSEEYEQNSPLRATRYEGESQRTRSENSPSGHSQSTSSRLSDKRQQQPNMNDLMSPSKTEKSATTFSVGAYGYTYPQIAQQPPSSPAGMSARTGISTRKGSRLRQEVIMSPASPEEPMGIDLFPFTRARLSDVPYQQSRILDENSMTPDDLRLHMLNVVFGWDDDIRALIADELERQPADTLNALFLTRWLSPDVNVIAEIMGSTPADASIDWARLALGILDSRPESKKLGQIFVEKMLSRGEVHTAVVALLALGDKNDAIEVYVSRNCFLEAILLTCLLMPSDWQRQSHLVRKWGEHVVENSQQHLAIRCFSCTAVEPADPWVSPTAQLVNKVISPVGPVLQQSFMTPQQLQHQPLPSMPPINHLARIKGLGYSDAQTPVAMPAPPTPFRTAAAKGTRITPLNGGLKLITSFGPKRNEFKFPGLKTEDMTPTNTTNITPIAESAIDRSALSPAGSGSYRMNNIRSLNAALSVGPRSARPRLASIGETPVDSETPVFPVRPLAKAPPTPADSGSDKEKEKIAAARMNDQDLRKERSEPALTVLGPAKYDPNATPVQQYDPNQTPQTALRPATVSTWHNSLSQVKEEPTHGRNGSRGKKPDGLSLQVLQVREIENHYEMLDPLVRPGTTESHTTNFTASPPPTGGSYRVKSPSVSGRSIDQYISSLEQAQLHGRTRSRNSSRPPKEGKSERKQSKHRNHKYSQDVSDTQEIPASKRSPSSPVPMSPEDLRAFTASVESFDSVYNSASASANEVNHFSSRHQRRESGSTVEAGRQRHRSRSTQGGMRRRTSTKGIGRITSPPLEEPGRRGRSKSRKEGTAARSPSSPLPMVPSEEDRAGPSSGEPAFRFVNQNRSRLQRSTSRRPERGTSARRDTSPDRRRNRERSPSRQREEASTAISRKSSVSGKTRRKKRDASEEPRRSDNLHYDSLEQLDALADSIRSNTLSNPRQTGRSKELAQAELEARRQSLARRPSAPNIPLPGHMTLLKSVSDGIAAPPALTRNLTDTAIRTGPRNPLRQENIEENATLRERPGTPQAMDHPSDSQDSANPPETLSSAAYQLPARTYSANTNRDQDGAWLQIDIPQTMPRHPAFDHRVGQSRGKSRSRTRAESSDRFRGKSVERSQMPPEEEASTYVVGSPDLSIESVFRNSTGPVVIPELQHLAVPPPPPPPPAPPKQLLPLRIQTDISNAAAIPLPKSAYPTNSAEPQSATPDKHHKRMRSTNEGQFMGKIRGITDRMRSTSRPRDNMTRSPNMEDGIMSPYETVTMNMPPPLTSISERR